MTIRIFLANRDKFQKFWMGLPNWAMCLALPLLVVWLFATMFALIICIPFITDV